MYLAERAIRVQRDLDQAPAFTIGRWKIDPAVCTLTMGDITNKIEPRLMRLLTALARANGGLLTKERIVAEVWDREEIGDDTIASAVSRLRQALGDDAKRQTLIRTISRRGYALTKSVAIERSEIDINGLDVDVLCARGREVLRLGTPQGLEQARVYFDAACNGAPASSSAHAGFACTRLVQYFAGYANREDCLETAVAAAQRSVVLDPNNSMGWAAYGFARFITGGDPTQVEQCFRSALAVAGEHGIAYRWYALFLVSCERFDEAELMARRAVAHEPFSLAAYRVLVQVLLIARRYKIVLEEARSALSLSSAEPAIWLWFGFAHQFMGADGEAYAAYQKSFDGSFDWGLRKHCDAAFAQEGLKGFFRVIADQQEESGVTIRPIDRAIVCTFAGEHARAVRFLEAAIAHGDPQLAWLHLLPHFDGLRGHPTFDRLVRGLTQYRSSE